MTLKHGQPAFNRRTKKQKKVQRSMFNRWVAGYLEALFEDRPVHVLPQYQRELDLFLW